MNSYTKRGGAQRRRFCVICKKPEGGGRKSTPPPGVRVLTAIYEQMIPRSVPKPNHTKIDGNEERLKTL